MSKTLVVSYLPNAYSVTKKVLDHFLTTAKGKTTIIDRDLVKNHPPVFDTASMTAYQLRGFMGKTLDAAQSAAIKPFDTLLDELSGADHVVFAFPTHNWSEPGVVKSYIDAVLQAGKTIKYDEKGQAHGQLTKLKALVIFASGGVYDQGHARQTIIPAFTFYLNAIGVTDIAFAPVGGTLMGDEATAKAVASGNAVVDGAVAKWFK